MAARGPPPLPSHQIALVAAARDRGIPIVADEVFSGLWRLGAVSGCSLLGVRPDVAAYAKLLTGGALPLAATLASDRVFSAFSGGGKAGALLHGHSYSAHAAGAAAAVAALGAYTDPGLNPGACTPERCTAVPRCASACGLAVPAWGEAGLTALAAHPAVDRAIALGTVLAAQLKSSDGGGSGYAATASAGVAARLRARGVHARPLGDVVYLMRAPTAHPASGEALQEALLAALPAAA